MKAKTSSKESSINGDNGACGGEAGVKRAIFSSVLVVALILLVIASFIIGRYPVGIAELVRFLLTGEDLTEGGILKTVVYHIRFPRIIAAIMAGAGLSAAGTAFQGLFRNPIASPDILGVASGAGFGAGLGILLSGEIAVVQTLAFAFGLLSVGLVYVAGRFVKSNSTLALILAGMAVGGVFNALLAMLKYVADPVDQLPSIVFWLMGSLASVDNRDIMFAAVPMTVGLAVLYSIRWRLNIMAMGEEEAMTLGLNTTRFRFITVVSATMVTASVVCVSGIIGWIGLVIPHICRMIVGPCHKKLLPVSALMGAVYLLFIDNIARSSASVEIPLGILTALVGAPVFLYLIATNDRSWA